MATFAAVEGPASFDHIDPTPPEVPDPFEGGHTADGARLEASEDSHEEGRVTNVDSGPPDQPGDAGAGDSATLSVSVDLFARADAVVAPRDRVVVTPTLIAKYCGCSRELAVATSAELEAEGAVGPSNGSKANAHFVLVSDPKEAQRIVEAYAACSRDRRRDDLDITPFAPRGSQRTAARSCGKRDP